MSTPFTRVGALLLTVGLLVGACGGSGTVSPIAAPSSGQPSASVPAAASAAPSASGSTAAGPPLSVDLPWGTFKLAARIAAKVANHEPLLLGLSDQGKTIPVYSPQFGYGWAKGLTDYNSVYPITGTDFSAVESTTPAQIANLEAAINANQVDCIGLDGGGLDVFIPLIDKATAAGIPVFTLGSDQPNSHRIGTFLPDFITDGHTLATAVADWSKSTGNPVKKVAMTSGQWDANWAQQDMIGFREKLQELVPGVEFVNTEKDALATSFDPQDVYDKVRAYLAGHRDLDVIMQTDQSAEFVNKAIRDLGLEGKVRSVAWNVAEANLKDIESGTQIATIDDDFPGQPYWGINACQQFILNSVVLPNPGKGVAITKDNIAEARAKYGPIGSANP